ncbi:SapC family protein [Sphingomonas sp. MMS24-JH45]
MRPANVAPFLVDQHAIPLTVEEFPLAQRHMPIVFSAGDKPVPIGLMGLNEGVNVFIDAEGKLIEDNFYVPAYIRRYPWMLAASARTRRSCRSASTPPPTRSAPMTTATRCSRAASRPS